MFDLIGRIVVFAALGGIGAGFLIGAFGWWITRGEPDEDANTLYPNGGKPRKWKDKP